jgi:hypothetical protein
MCECRILSGALSARLVCLHPAVSKTTPTSQPGSNGERQDDTPWYLLIFDASRCWTFHSIPKFQSTTRMLESVLGFTKQVILPSDRHYVWVVVFGTARIPSSVITHHYCNTGQAPRITYLIPNDYGAFQNPASTFKLTSGEIRERPKGSYGLDPARVLQPRKQRSPARAWTLTWSAGRLRLSAGRHPKADVRNSPCFSRRSPGQSFQVAMSCQTIDRRCLDSTFNINFPLGPASLELHRATIRVAEHYQTRERSAKRHGMIQLPDSSIIGLRA